MSYLERLQNLSPAQRAAVAQRLELNSSANQILSAFVAGDALCTERDLREFLSRQLPRYMHPRNIEILAELPRTDNGKVDRRALRHREVGISNTSPASNSNDTERQLIAIWREVLGQEQVKPGDNFFDLGGDSLRAMSLFSRIDKSFQISLPIETIFEHPTVSELARAVRPAAELGEHPGIIVLQKGKGLTPLFCMHCGGGNLFWYRHLATQLGDNRPVLGLLPSGVDGKSEFHQTVEAMAQCYVQRMQAVFPRGPYMVCGYSFGGSIAYEIARQLRAQGCEVVFTGLFDACVYGTLTRTHSLPEHRSRLAKLDMQGKVRHVGRSLFGNLRTVYLRSSRAVRRLRSWVPARVCLAAGRAIPVEHRPAYLRGIFGRAMLNYVPKPYEGTVTIYKQTQSNWEYRDHPDLGWAPFVAEKRLQLVEIAGEHGDMLDPPVVEELAAHLRRSIRAY